MLLPYLVGVWEKNEGISAALSVRACGSVEAKLIGGDHPADFAGLDLDLLVVSPEAVGWAGAGNITCRAVLLHGAAGPLVRILRAGYAVSYGTSPRDTLTFSSLEEGEHVCLALQRELVTLEGTILEPQEWRLPYPAGVSPLTYLAVAGGVLLLGGSSF